MKRLINKKDLQYSFKADLIDEVVLNELINKNTKDPYSWEELEVLSSEELVNLLVDSKKVYIKGDLQMKKEELKNEEFSNDTLTDYIVNNDLIGEVFGHYENELIDIENDLIDSKLTYTSDFWDTLKEYTTPSDMLNGKYSWDDLIEDMTYHLTVEEKLSDLIDYVGKNEMIEFINSIL